MQALASAAARWGLTLSESQQDQLSRYLELVLSHNRKVNLTADADPKDLLLRHVADGLAAVPLLKEGLSKGSPRILDLGSGGGFIGIAIKIAWPEAQVTLMEALKRKYDFLNVAAAAVGLKGLRVLRKTAGQGPLSPAERSFDAVVARALAPLPEALELAVPLAEPEGLVVIYQSGPPDAEDPALKKALEKLSAGLVAVRRYRLPLEDRDRCLAAFRRLHSAPNPLHY